MPSIHPSCFVKAFHIPSVCTLYSCCIQPFRYNHMTVILALTICFFDFGVNVLSNIKVGISLAHK